MRAPSRQATVQASVLARELGSAAGVACRVDLSTEVPAADPGGSWWWVHWCDGPTTSEMQALAAERAPQVAPLLALEAAGYERGESDLGLATALLWWLAQDHPGTEGPVDLWLALTLDDALPGRPHTAPDDIARRARVLLAHGWTRRTALPIAGELEQRARGGWVGVAAWLDALADTPTLDARRAGRVTRPER